MRRLAASRNLWSLVLPTLLSSGLAQAHHSAAVFDATREVELHGTVVDFKLRSPHSSFVIDARVVIDGEAQGEFERWEIESQSVPVLRSQGIDEQTFEPGDAVTMTVAPSRDPDFKFAHSLAIFDEFGGAYVMANSDRLYSPSVREAAGARGGDEPAGAGAARLAAGLAASGSREARVARLEGRWQQPFTRFTGNGPGIPLNEAGMAAWRSYDRKQSPANTCEPINVPDIFFSAFFLFELRIEEGRALLRNEYYDVRRAVPLDGTSAAAAEADRFGHARGRIEGGALVVETRAFAASGWGLGIEEARGADIPSSVEKTLVERFSATADGRTLVYEYTLFDPSYMASPHRGRVELTRVPDDEPFHAFDCDRESAAMWSRTRGDAPLQLGAAGTQGQRE